METATMTATTTKTTEKPKRLALTTTESGIIGACAGTLEVFVNQPFVSWKNARQQKLPFTLSPLFLYRGVVINSASIAPITAVQFAVNGKLGAMLSNDGQRQLTSSEKLTIAAIAGAASALVSTPAEMVMIQQQKSGTKLLETAKQVLTQHGLLTFYKGFIPTVVRESLFTCGYLGLSPVLKGYVKEYIPALADKDLPASLFASILAGQVAAILTQPADTVKTRLQGDIKEGVYTRLSVALSIMWKEGGLRTLYSGLVPRGLRMTSAVFILGLSGDRMSQFLLNR